MLSGLAVGFGNTDFFLTILSATENLRETLGLDPKIQTKVILCALLALWMLWAFFLLMLRNKGCVVLNRTLTVTSGGV